MATPTALLGIRMSADEVRRALLRSGVTVAVVKPVVDHPDRHLRTEYLDGEGQRRRKSVLAANEGTIIGWATRGMPVRMIAAAFMVSEEAIHSRLRSSGISRSISHRKVEVHAQAAQEPRLVVKANDHQA